MGQTSINNGDSGLTVRNAINGDFAELFADAHVDSAPAASALGGTETVGTRQAGGFVKTTMTQIATYVRSLIVANDITNASVVGKSMLTAANSAAQTALLDIGTAAVKGLAPAAPAPSGKFLKDDWTWANAPASAGGDVVGPASSLDNAFVRFDSTTGKLVQDSIATLSDIGCAVLGGTTVTANLPVLAITQTWNNAGVTFIGVSIDITPTGAAAASTPLIIKRTGVTQFKIDRDGVASFTQTISASNGMNATSGSAIGMTGGKFSLMADVWGINSAGIIGIGNSTSSNTPDVCWARAGVGIFHLGGSASNNNGSLEFGEVTAPGGVANMIRMYSDDDGQGNTRMRVVSPNGDAGSIPTTRFSAHKNGTDQTAIVPSTFTKLTFGTEIYDTDAKFDAVTNYRWTPPAGYVHIIGAAQITAGMVDATPSSLIIYKNGTAWKYIANVQASGTGGFTLIGSAYDQSNGTDYYELWFVGGGAGNKTIGGAATNTFFQGSVVG